MFPEMYRFMNKVIGTGEGVIHPIGGEFILGIQFFTPLFQHRRRLGGVRDGSAESLGDHPRLQRGGAPPVHARPPRYLFRRAGRRGLRDPGGRRRQYGRHPGVRPILRGRPPADHRASPTGSNRGKGYSVRHGLLEARGRVLLFSDSDLSTPIEETPKLLGKLAEGYGVAVASRYTPDSRLRKRQPFGRRLARIGFNFLVRAITGLRFRDTQCGFKALTRESAEIIAPRLTIPDFGFDVELLWLAKRFRLRTAEVGVVWLDDPRSRVHVIRDSWRMFLDLFRIRWRDWRGKYS